MSLLAGTSRCIMSRTNYTSIIVGLVIILVLNARRSNGLVDAQELKFNDKGWNLMSLRKSLHRERAAKSTIKESPSKLTKRQLLEALKGIF
ncbi:hypothetical protein HNY73_007235 [Argiope bruennichi]|uniref:Uncharacterized protein n=1 Tax=Argiope bruennichi TaxID=94029 RepID=A0A8T0FEB7_ARGBR|nr:hypothetical protein HNY73_007235 [Argiope bruennichi]